LRLGNKIDSTWLKVENKIAQLTGEMIVVKWMLGTLLAVNIAVALKTFLH